jgi:hypothetical protein
MEDNGLQTRSHLKKRACILRSKKIAELCPPKYQTRKRCGGPEQVESQRQPNPRTSQKIALSKTLIDASAFAGTSMNLQAMYVRVTYP